MNVPRVEYGLPNVQYRDAPGLSHTESKQLRKSPFHFKKLSEPRPPELVKGTSPQMFMGTMTHVATLEPHAFDERYVVGPDISKNSNAWKQFAQECIDRGVEPIAQVQRDAAFSMATSVRALPDFAPLIEGCDTEVSMWWHCPVTGVLCKARPDLVKRYPPGIRVLGDDARPLDDATIERMHDKGFAILADLKTTESADPESFARSVADYSYHTQAHWYIEGVEQALGVPVLSFMFVVVERDYPFAAASYQLDANALRVAADINASVRKLYVDCKKADRWPGYASETVDISLPQWYMKRYLEGLPV